MLFPKLYKIMVKKVSFVGFRGAIAPPLDPPLIVVKCHKYSNFNI